LYAPNDVTPSPHLLRLVKAPTAGHVLPRGERAREFERRPRFGQGFGVRETASKMQGHLSHVASFLSIGDLEICMLTRWRRSVNQDAARSGSDSQRSRRLMKKTGPCHSERSEESPYLWNQANTEILRRLRMLRMTLRRVFQQPLRNHNSEFSFPSPS